MPIPCMYVASDQDHPNTVHAAFVALRLVSLADPSLQSIMGVWGLCPQRGPDSSGTASGQEVRGKALLKLKAS